MKAALSFKIIIAILFLGVLAVAQDDATDIENEAKMEFNAGNKAYKEGKVGEAIEKYKAAVQIDPGFALAHYWLGNAHRRNRDYVSAAQAYQNAIDKNNQLVGAYTALGFVQLRQQKYKEALNTYEAAVKIDPQSDKAYWGIGEVYRREKNYQKAIHNFGKAVEIDPENAQAWEGKGVSHAELGQHEEAVTAFQSAIDNLRGASAADVYLRQGDSYRQIGDLAKAEEAYQNCLKYARRSVIKGGANFGLGEIHKKRGSASQAIRFYQEAARDRTWKQSAEYEIDLLKNPDKYSG